MPIQWVRNAWYRDGKRHVARLAHVHNDWVELHFLGGHIACHDLDGRYDPDVPSVCDIVAGPFDTKEEALYNVR